MTTRDDWLNGALWLIGGIILDFAIQILGVGASQGLAMVFGQPANGLLATVLLILIVLAMTYGIATLLIYAVRLKSPNLRLHPIKWDRLKYVFLGYVGIVVGIMLVNFVRVLLTGDVDVATNQQVLQDTFNQGPYGIVFVGVLAIIVAPIVEELIFRGIVMNYFFKNKGWWWNIILSAGLFGYFHVYAAFNPFDFLQYALMGGILAYIYKKTHQLQYAMLAHALNNTLSFLAMMAML
ncbi:CPBP family intramembrane glutamic endopeptidase [Weissella tructae]|uniref:Metal-dependent membrane protease n=1 Tax=Weissella tructae TaxID=887702 RepID=A0ABM5QU00_9LACO|nr:MULTISPECIES: type II CAAX endopeptidase family protein [Weissella]AIG65289.1 putative metal-dependent membrane protease [Weissella tructae]ELA07691.1 metal-dependent membrane protease [Weissella ceti NC36]QVV91670.1 CPBP family intramembrane metalloprotease [Weissella tructae]